MKKLICTSLLALAVSTANAADHKPGFYGRIEGGASFMYDSKVKKEVGTLFAGGLAAGYKLNDMDPSGFRGELNVRYKQGKILSTTGEKGTVREIPIFLNGYYDIHTHTILTPYITVGAGTVIYSGTSTSLSRARKNIEPSSGSKTTLLFAWNAGAGTKCQLNKTIDLDLSYKFIGVNPGLQVYGSHNITAGLVFNF